MPFKVTSYQAKTLACGRITGNISKKHMGNEDSENDLEKLNRFKKSRTYKQQSKNKIYEV